MLQTETANLYLFAANGNGKLHLFAANRNRNCIVLFVANGQGNGKLPFVCCKRKRKRQTSVGLLQTETENGSLFFLGLQPINGNPRLDVPSYDGSSLCYLALYNFVRLYLNIDR